MIPEKTDIQKGTFDLDAAICYFYYKDSPSMKLAKSIAPYGSVELEMLRNTKDALDTVKCLFEAAIPERFFIFAELKALTEYSIEAFAVKGGKLLPASCDVNHLSRAMTHNGIAHFINEKPLVNTANAVYYKVLSLAAGCGSTTKAVLINMPSLKNIAPEDFDVFCRFMNDYIEGERRYLNRVFMK